jgi:hypothetical protein
MPRPAAIIRLTPDEEESLKQYLRSGTAEHRAVERARVILLAHQGHTTQEIAQTMHTRPRASVEMAAAARETSIGWTARCIPFRPTQAIR